MLVEAIRTLFAHERWAMEQVFAAAEGFTAEELDAPGPGGQRSIRETVLHICDGHRRWRSW